MTSTAVAAVAKFVDEARPLGGATCRATAAATAVDPTGAKLVGAGRLGKQSRDIEVPKASCQKSVEVDQTMQRVIEQVLDMV